MLKKWPFLWLIAFIVSNKKFSYGSGPFFQSYTRTTLFSRFALRQLDLIENKCFVRLLHELWRRKNAPTFFLFLKSLLQATVGSIDKDLIHSIRWAYWAVEAGFEPRSLCLWCATSLATMLPMQQKRSGSQPAQDLDPHHWF